MSNELFLMAKRPLTFQVGDKPDAHRIEDWVSPIASNGCCGIEKKYLVLFRN
jgi:hypothetical protein